MWHGSVKGFNYPTKHETLGCPNVDLKLATVYDAVPILNVSYLLYIRFSSHLVFSGYSGYKVHAYLPSKLGHYVFSLFKMSARPTKTNIYVVLPIFQERVISVDEKTLMIFSSPSLKQLRRYVSLNHNIYLMADPTHLDALHACHCIVRPQCFYVINDYKNSRAYPSQVIHRGGSRYLIPMMDLNPFSAGTVFIRHNMIGKITVVSCLDLD